jgi:hypothetical protein
MKNLPFFYNAEIEIILNGKVDQILTLKQSNASADTSLLEREIDLMVYELYGLSEEEIGVVEGGEKRFLVRGAIDKYAKLIKIVAN